jgi:hypothetical protein
MPGRHDTAVHVPVSNNVLINEVPCSVSFAGTSEDCDREGFAQLCERQDSGALKLMND